MKNSKYIMELSAGEWKINGKKYQKASKTEKKYFEKFFNQIKNNKKNLKSNKQ